MKKTLVIYIFILLQICVLSRIYAQLPLNGGLINDMHIILDENYNYLSISSIKTASGGSGVYSYQWEYSNRQCLDSDEEWVAIPNATSATLNYNRLTSALNICSGGYMRRKVKNGTQIAYSNETRISNPNSICFAPNGEYLSMSFSFENSFYTNRVVEVVEARYVYLYSNSENSITLKIDSNLGSSYVQPYFKLLIRDFIGEDVVNEQYITILGYQYHKQILTGNEIGSDQSILYGAQVEKIGVINFTSYSGCNIRYQWQQSEDNIIWTNMPYEWGEEGCYPPPLTKTMYYRQKVTADEQVAYSNVVTVTVENEWKIGESQLVQVDAIANRITTIRYPTGATSSYQWQMSNDLQEWTDIAGETDATGYTPINYDITCYYRFKYLLEQNEMTSNVIEVKRILSGGSISLGLMSKSSIENYSQPIGGNGQYTYQWQKSNTENGPWVDVVDVCGPDYPRIPTVNTPTYYRRKVSGGDMQTAYSNVLLFVAELKGGKVGGYADYIISSCNRYYISDTESASGGVGSYSYTWERYDERLSSWEEIPEQIGTYFMLTSNVTQNLRDAIRRKVTSGGQTAYSNVIKTNLLSDISCHGARIELIHNLSAEYNEVAVSVNNSNFMDLWSDVRNNMVISVQPNNTATVRPVSIDFEIIYMILSPENYDIIAKTPVKLNAFQLGVLEPGRIGEDQVVNVGNRPNTIISLTPATGGDGKELLYSWQFRKEGDISWLPIPNKIDMNYWPEPNSVAASYQYRRVAKSGDIVTYSNIITIRWRERLELQGIKKTVYLEPDSPDSVVEEIIYNDGFNRNIQTIQSQMSKDGNDIISFVNYDAMGRAGTKQYLPYVANQNNGRKIQEPLQEQQAYYASKFAESADRDYAYTEKVYDNSSLGLVLSQKGVGKTSNEHPVEFSFRYNNQNDEIRIYRIVNDSILTYTDYYGDNLLAVKGNWISGDDVNQKGERYEYTNCAGQVVAVELRVSQENRKITYYVYDEMGRQRYVIPAIANSLLLQATDYIPTSIPIRQYCYYSKYDKFGNVTEQLVPGADRAYNIYNKYGKLVMSQSARMRAGENAGNPQWAVIQYDSVLRALRTGIHYGGDYEYHKSIAQSSSDYNYPVVLLPENILSETYYDNYDWLKGEQKYAYRHNGEFNATPALGAVSGLATGSRTKIFDASGRYITNVIYYNDNYQTIQSISDLYPEGIEVVWNSHNFTGNIVATRVIQEFGNNINYGYDKWFNYDNKGRLVSVEQQIDSDDVNGRVALIAYAYDDFGNVMSKSVHNGLDETIFTHNISGGISDMSSSAFSYQINSENNLQGDKSNYNGNIDNVIWSRNGEPKHSYSYSYDAGGQLSSTTYYQQDDLGDWRESSARKEGGITYDDNGNILSVKRTDSNGAILHDIVFNYNGNQINHVTFNGVNSSTYEYDTNGNMTFDGLRGIWIEYNEMDLPCKIFAGTDTIRYIYNAAGEKLATVAGGSSIYYRSVMVYSSSASGQEELLYLQHPEGVIANSEGNYTYKYFKADHIGSTRCVLAAVGNELIEEQITDYYPFGTAWSLDDLHQNLYLYSGKEFQDATLYGTLLGLYDFGARYYDPILGRWFNVDPALQLANPYLYCSNNPAMFIDPDGRAAWMIPLLIGIIKGAAIGAAIGIATYTLNVAMSENGFSNWSWNQFWRSAGFGALGGAVTFGIGEAFSALGNFAGGVGSEAIRGVAHGLAQGGLGALQGGDFASSALGGMLGSWAASGFSAIPGVGNSLGGQLAFGALAGGVGSVAMGGDFLQGAAIGLMVAGLNHGMHKLASRKQEGGMHVFNSEKEAYAYMHEASEKGGYAYKEHAAYVLEDGRVVLLPVENNTSQQSYNYRRLLKQQSDGSYKLLGYNSKVVGYTHTHPGSPIYNPSSSDIAFRLARPTFTHKLIDGNNNIHIIK